MSHSHGKTKKAAPNLFHTLAWELKAALSKKGCPICRVVTENLERFYFWLLTQNYYEPGTIKELKSCYGLCNLHAWQLISSRQAFVIAVTYEYIVEDALGKINLALTRLADERWRSVPDKRKQREEEKVKKTLAPTGRCPACENVGETTRNNLAWLAEGLKEPEVFELYRRSEGLCFRHFLKAVQVCPREIFLKLADDQKARLEHLQTDLKEYIRKTNYLYAHEPKGKEQNSWTRAIDLLVGPYIAQATKWDRFNWPPVQPVP